VIKEACVQGISTRSVDELVTAMGMTGLSKSQMSRLCVDIDERVNAFLERPLEGDWPYLWIDATYAKVRQGGRLVSVATKIAPMPGAAKNNGGRSRRFPIKSELELLGATATHRRETRKTQADEREAAGFRSRERDCVEEYKTRVVPEVERQRPDAARGRRDKRLHIDERGGKCGIRPREAI
jgi:hypothetical protein